MKKEKPAAFNNLGLSFFEFGDYEAAIESYSQAIVIDNTAVNLNNRGLAYYQDNQILDAKSDFTEAIELEPNDPNSYFNRGNVFLNWKPEPQFSNAHKDYDRALDLAPKDVKLIHQKGLAYQIESEYIKSKTGEYSERLNESAIKMYSIALKYDSGFISSYHHLGVMYHRTCKFYDALMCFSNVLKKFNKDRTVYIARGKVFQDMENHQNAIEDFNYAIKFDNKLPEGYFLRAWSKFYLKRFHDSIKDFRMAKTK